MLTVEELTAFVPAAKEGDPHALEVLCESFAPLIYKISHRQTVYNVLGEDAVNIIWVWFIEIVLDYKGTNFEKFPGLVRKSIITRVINLFKCQGRRFDTEQLSTMEDDIKVANIPDKDLFEDMLEKMSLAQEIDNLTTRNYTILKRFYCNNEPLEAIAVDLKMSPRTVRYYRAKALDDLHKRLEIDK